MKTPFMILVLMFIGLLSVAQTTELERLTNVPALIPENDPPMGGGAPNVTLNFDKLVMITATKTSGLEIPIYLYINTTNGDIATITGIGGVAEDGSFDINDPEFALTYFNPHGRVYSFYTRKKKGKIERYMSSMNTEIVPFSMSIPFERTTVYRTGAGINPLPQGFEAHSFKASGNNAPTLILCGGKPGTKPNKLLLKRFIGYSGIGYVKTNEGIFMVVKMKSNQGGFTATKWKNERHKVTISDFKHVESEMYADMFAQNEQKTAKLEAKTFTGKCADIENRINQLKIAQKRKEKKNIEEMAKGNPMNDANVRNATKEMYNLHVEQLQVTDLEVDLKLCKLESKSIKSELDAQKRTCLMEEKARIQQAMAELATLKQRYSGPNGPPLFMTPEYRDIDKRMRTKSSKCK